MTIRDPRHLPRTGPRLDHYLHVPHGYKPDINDVLVGDLLIGRDPDPNGRIALLRDYYGGGTTGAGGGE